MQPLPGGKPFPRPDAKRVARPEMNQRSAEPPLLDALLDPDISLVTCYGHAGTGKTLLAVAAGLSAVYSNTFRGLTISRPVRRLIEQARRAWLTKRDVLNAMSLKRLLAWLAR